MRYANITSSLALFVALGGTGYAALKLPKDSVHAKQIATGAVRSAEVKNHSLRPVDFAALPTGPKGDKGDKGDPGAPATSRGDPFETWLLRFNVPPGTLRSPRNRRMP